jgi:predicted PurR-regulated permease PerM
MTVYYFNMTNKSQLYFFFTILLGVSVLTFFIFKPFLVALVLAVVSAVVFYPIYKRIYKRMPKWPGSAAILTLLGVVAFIVVPFVFLGMQIFQEAGQFYAHLSAGGGKDGILGAIDIALHKIQNLFPITQGFVIDVDQYMKQGLEWFLQNLGLVFSNLSKILLSFFVFMIAFYYLLKDGAKIREFVLNLSPLGDDDDSEILNKLEAATNGVVKGRLLISLVQGAVTALGFLLFGVPNPVLWGSVAAIASLVPGVGTMIVFAPATLFLFLTEGSLPGLGLLAWGVGVVGLVDNLLAPKLLGRGTKLHPLLVLLSVLGGLIFFGPIGIFLGPLVVSLLLALLDLHFLGTGGKKN